jgi:hypothetical protein
MILRPQFWRGQQYGGRSAPPHARHMRPLCNNVSSSKTKVLACNGFSVNSVFRCNKRGSVTEEHCSFCGYHNFLFARLRYLTVRTIDALPSLGDRQAAK